MCSHYSTVISNRILVQSISFPRNGSPRSRTVNHAHRIAVSDADSPPRRKVDPGDPRGRAPGTALAEPRSSRFRANVARDSEK